MSEPGLFGGLRSPVRDLEGGEAPYGHAELCMSHRGRPLRWLRTIWSLVRDHEDGCQKGCPFVKFDCGNDFTVPAMGAIKQPEIVGRHEETGRIRSSKSESCYSFCCDKFVASRMRASRVRSCPTYKSAVFKNFHIRWTFWDPARRVGWGEALAELLYRGAGYLALYDRGDDSPWHIITYEDATKAASE